ncbi:MAG: hypothetical protein ACRCWJ_15030 [Casimicrobium sp.]
MAGVRTVLVSHRGQDITYCYPSDAIAGAQPLLVGVLDWYERASIAQVVGYEQGETPSSTIALNNEDKQVQRDWDYPLRAKVSVRDDGVEVLSGEVVSFTLGPQLELSIEA